jgi:hypothetical protein
MGKKKKERSPSAELLHKLAALEDAAISRGIHIHYDRLEAAGLRLNGGLCALNGEYHLFVEKRKSVADKIDFIKKNLEHSRLKDTPEINGS